MWPPIEGSRSTRYVVARVSQFERGLEAGDAAADDQVAGLTLTNIGQRLLILDAFGQADTRALAFSVAAAVSLRRSSALAVRHLER